MSGSGSHLIKWLTRSSHLLPVVLGLTDGILNALTLAAGRMGSADRPVTAGLAARLALVAFASGAFVFFVARYAELRRELIHAERELNLLSHGKLATSHLGKRVRREALLACALSSLSSFVGSLIPLLTACWLPHLRWAPFLAALAVLALLGIGLARAVAGRAIVWSASLVIGGVALSAIGLYLKIV